MIRSLLRKVLYTPNTIRYRVEWPRLEEAFKKVGKVQTLFDGGAGSGEFAKRALHADFCQDVIALEYDENNFIRLKENLGKKKATLIQGSLLDIPLADESVQMVMSTQVIEHIDDHQKAASELVRVLQPGRHMLITVPHPPEPFPNEGHFREGYTEDDLKSLFEPLGMTLLHTDYFLCKGTIDKMIKAGKMPLKGRFIPVALVDEESGFDFLQRKEDQPFGILALFVKNG